MFDTTEGRMIRSFYGDLRAERSGVPLMNHIDEGAAVLKHIGATHDTIRAFMVHPLFQSDEDLHANFHLVADLEPEVVLMVMEYRNQANAWLSDKVFQDRYVNSNDKVILSSPRMTGRPTPGPLNVVRQMLVADKVQNYKDFLTYHQATHERSAELQLYFAAWFDALHLTDADYKQLASVIDNYKASK